MTGWRVLQLALGALVGVEGLLAGLAGVLAPWTLLLTGPWLVASAVGYAHAITYGFLVNHDPT